MIDQTDQDLDVGCLELEPEYLIGFQLRERDLVEIEIVDCY
jgi:hypothetical protein